MIFRARRMCMRSSRMNASSAPAKRRMGPSGQRVRLKDGGNNGDSRHQLGGHHAIAFSIRDHPDWRAILYVYAY